MQGCVRRNCYPLKDGCKEQGKEDHTECFYWHPDLETAELDEDTVICFDAKDGWFTIADESEGNHITLGVSSIGRLIEVLETIKRRRDGKRL